MMPGMVPPRLHTQSGMAMLHWLQESRLLLVISSAPDSHLASYWRSATASDIRLSASQKPSFPFTDTMSRWEREEEEEEEEV